VDGGGLLRWARIIRRTWCVAGRWDGGVLDVDVALARRLVAGLFAEWAGLPVVATAAWGTDNAMFRLGAEMAVRLPRHPRWAGQGAEQR
jgi:aminoglycoside phosphotransferase (APT) family kinase protein